MKIGLYADAHFSLSSSIVTGSSGSLGGRLSNITESFRYMYSYFQKEGVELIINLGDLTNSPHLRAEEITALSIALAYNPSIPEIHLLGNHEALSGDGSVNSVSFLPDLITVPEIRNFNTWKFLFLPYTNYTEEDIDSYNADIVFGHLEIKGSQASSNYFLQSGISPDFLSKKFKLTISGHTHKHSKVKKNVINLGSLSGLNFSSDGDKHFFGILSLDNSTWEMEYIDNPHAIQFRKVEVKSLGGLNRVLVGINHPENFALQISCPYDLKEDVRKLLSQFKIGYSRIVSKSDIGGIAVERHAQEIDKITSVEEGFKVLYKFFADTKKEGGGLQISDIKKVLRDVVEFTA